ncbi:hypothetical protein SUGI_0766520 [Cryptomeria japonica]|uniref:uncharacterized protein LOC131078513 n=1 Tax=Cryptomeria japonica TaxID=3369 RepID=UPI002414B517|nr:uncharacterized protein LOC131078513 [Cryptomeria japonica]GLJ37729.1 hypothetical protein SUGI_0766520 [Cryptomeria japonica]
MELQADLLLSPRSQHLGISVEQHQHKENSPPFFADRLPTPSFALQFFKRQPLQDITHLFATNDNTQSIYDGRRMSSVMETRGLVEQTSSAGNKKRRSTNLSNDSNISSSNLKRPLLRRDFR